MKRAIEVLKAARGRIARGWCQKAYWEKENGEHRYCILGAVLASQWAQKYHDDVSLDALQETLGTGAGWIAAWNDAPGRTQEEVLALFDATIVRLEGLR